MANNPTLLDRLATTHKIIGDLHIKCVALWPRKYSLDALPLLINVLKRDMSLMGPRMISPPALKQYTRNYSPWQDLQLILQSMPVILSRSGAH